MILYSILQCGGGEGEGTCVCRGGEWEGESISYTRVICGQKLGPPSFLSLQLP